MFNPETMNQPTEMPDSEKEKSEAVECETRFDFDENTPQESKENRDLSGEISPNQSKVYLIFHRHGEHIVLPETKEKDYPLSERGHKEMADLGHDMKVLEKQAIGFHANNLRSMASVSMVMQPETKQEDTKELSQRYSEHGRIHPLEKLQYKTINHERFRNGLKEAFDQGRMLSFLTYESDILAGDSAPRLSTYSTTAREMAEILKKYFAVEKNWATLSDQYENKNLYRLFCGRRFIYACFRAKLTEKILGPEERNRFIEWHDAHFQTETEREQKTALIDIKKGSTNEIIATLKDTFGALSFGAETLDRILKEGPHEQRTGTYLLPLRLTEAGIREVALVQYPDGFGFIGGGVQKDETLAMALHRELQEELDGISSSQVVHRLNKAYSFTMQQEGRPGSKEHIENFIFFVSPLASKNELTFKESGARIVWIPTESLLLGEVITHANLRNYIKEEVLPVVQTIEIDT